MSLILRPHAALLGVAFTLYAASAASAANAGDPYVKLDTLPGTSVTQGRTDWIEASSFQWGVGVGISSPIGGAPRQVGLPSLSEITWTQPLNPGVPRIMISLLSGTTLATSQFDLVAAAGGQGPRPPVLFTTTERVGITGVALANEGVSISQPYRNFSMTYDPSGLGRPGSTITTTYDVATNRSDGPLTRTPTVGEGTSAPQTGNYLRLGNGDSAIAGDVTSRGYENWTQIDSAQMGVARTFDPATGAFAGTTSLSELTLSQRFDATAPVVLANLMKVNPIGEATIEYVRNGVNGPVTFMQLVLEDLMFSSLSVSTAGDLPSVSESLNFTGFSQTVWNFKPDGSRGDPVTVGFDVATGRANGGRLASLTAGFGGGVYQPTVAVPIPEPQTWAPMRAGLGLVVVRGRRRAGG